MTILRKPPPSRLVGWLNQPAYFWNIDWRYRCCPNLSAKNLAESARIIDRAGRDCGHPTMIKWSSILPYPGGIYHTFKAVDRPLVEKAFPNNPKIAVVDFIDPLTIGGQLGKTLLAFSLMMFKSLAAFLVLLAGGDWSASGLSFFSASKEFGQALAYLSINASRSAAADLIAKAGPRPDKLKHVLGHIKIGKMTTSMLVTASAFPLLCWAKGEATEMFGENLSGKFFTAATICSLDGLVQTVTRRLRGFTGRVAFWDFFRPVVGDSMALLTFVGLGLNWDQHFLYLLTRKIFTELWTGHWESATKRKEKRLQRLNDLQKIFDLTAYKVPDPAAAAAINLCSIVSVKSLAVQALDIVINQWRRHFSVCSQIFGLSNPKPVFIQVLKAMEDDDRIKAAMDFQLPHVEWSEYRQVYWEKFVKHREYLRLWLSQNYPNWKSLLQQETSSLTFS